MAEQDQPKDIDFKFVGQGGAMNDTPRAAESTKVTPRRRRRWLFLFVGVPLILLVAAAVAYAVWLENAKARLAAAENRIRQRGEPLWYLEIRPEPLPPENDGTAALIRAIEIHNESYSQVLATSGDFPIYERNIEVFDPEMPAAEVDVLRQQLEAESEVIALIREVAAKGSVQLPHDYETSKPLYNLRPQSDESLYARSLRSVAALVQGQIALAVRDGEAQAATDLTVDLIKFSHAFREEPQQLTQLFRLAVLGTGERALCQTLGQVNLRDEQRLQLDAALAQAEGGISMRKTMLAQRAAIWTEIRHDPLLSSFTEMTQQAGDELEPPAFSYRALRHVRLEDQAVLLDLLSFEVEIVDDPTPGLFQELDKRCLEFFESPAFYATNLLTPSSTGIRSNALIHRQGLRHARLALRVDRYYRRTGEFPKQLSEVIAELEAAPLDAIPPALLSNLPPAFQPAEDGFAIYDVGKDRIDNWLVTEADRNDGSPSGTDFQEGRTLREVRYKNR